MTRPFTGRQLAEDIEDIGFNMLKALSSLDGLCRGMDPDTLARVNAIPHQDEMDTVARDLAALGQALSAECDQAEEADDRRRDNPLERDFRRLGQ